MINTETVTLKNNLIANYKVSSQLGHTDYTEIHCYYKYHEQNKERKLK